MGPGSTPSLGPLSSLRSIPYFKALSWFRIDEPQKTAQTLRRSRELVLVLCRVLVSGPNTVLLRCLDARLQILGRRQALEVDARRSRKEVPQGRNGY